MNTLAHRLVSRPGRIVVVAIAVALVVAPLMLSPYVNFQLTMMGVYVITLLGLDLLVGHAGQISLGQSAFLGLGAYVTAYGLGHGWPWPLTLVLSGLIPAVCGMLVAIPAVRLRGHSLAVVTVALPVIAVPLAIRYAGVTGGSAGLSVDWAAAPSWSGLADDQWRFYIVLVMMAVALLFARNLVHSRIGRAWRLLRTNEAAAVSVGIDAHRYKVLAFSLAALFGGVGGFAYLVAVQYVSPDSLSFLISINLMASLVIGGRAKLVGGLIGGAFYVGMPWAAGAVDQSKISLIYGIVLLVVLFFLPGGVASAGPRLSALLRRSPRSDDRLPGDAQPATAAGASMQEVH